MAEKENLSSSSLPPSWGIIHVYTGDGKGKTTAALGQAFRAAGWGGKVLVVQFLKDAGTPAGEIRAAEQLPMPTLTILRSPVPIPPFTAKTDAQRQAVTESVRDLWGKAIEAAGKGEWNLIVLDEVIVALSLGCLTEKQLKDFLKKRPPETTIILTGRGAPDWLVEAADLVTEMKNVKHPYDKGSPPRRGIEW